RPLLPNFSAPVPGKAGGGGEGFSDVVHLLLAPALVDHGGGVAVVAGQGDVEHDLVDGDVPPQEGRDDRRQQAEQDEPLPEAGLAGAAGGDGRVAGDGEAVRYLTDEAGAPGLNEGDVALTVAGQVDGVVGAQEERRHQREQEQGREKARQAAGERHADDVGG